MKEQDIAVYVENNLYELYRFVAAKNNKPNTQNDFCEWINAKPSPWPDYIFGADFSNVNIENAIANITEKINQNIAPSFWINRHTIYSEKLIKIFENNKFRLIMQWPGMAFSLKDYSHTHHQEDSLKIEIVSDQKELKEWIDIVNSELFPNNTLDINIFNNLINTKEVILFLGKLNGIPVSTSMIFIDNNIAGLYMVSTTNIHRNKGIAGKMTNKAKQYSFNANCIMLVLEANKESLKLYSKIGFKTYCFFDIYWKLPDAF